MVTLEWDILAVAAVAQLEIRAELLRPVARDSTAYGEDAATDRLVEAAGFEFVFSNFRIQRIRAAQSPRRLKQG